MTACTRASHDALKASEALFRASVLRCRPWPTEDGEPLLCGECARCRSTLAMRVPPQRLEMR